LAATPPITVEPPSRNHGGWLGGLQKNSGGLGGILGRRWVVTLRGDPSRAGTRLSGMSSSPQSERSQELHETMLGAA
jgi:hypothetical protein